MKLSPLKIVGLILIFLPLPCLALSHSEPVSRWKCGDYAIKVQNNVFEIIKGDTWESASARVYKRVNREFSNMVDRNFYAPSTIITFL